MSPTDNKKHDAVSFEKAVARLEKIVAEMESGNADLDEMVKLFEEGQKLTKICTDKLSAIGRKVEQLTRGEDGSTQIEPFVE